VGVVMKCNLLLDSTDTVSFGGIIVHLVKHQLFFCSVRECPSSGTAAAHQTELFPSSFHRCVTASRSTLGYHQTCNQHTSSSFHGQPIILRLFSYCSIGSLDGRLQGLLPMFRRRQTLDIGLSDAHKYRTLPYLRTGPCWLVPIGFQLLLAMSTNARDKNSGRLIQR